MAAMSDVLMAGVTDPGVKRENNEDAYLTVPEIGLAVLADGMGGHLAGEVASGIAVDIIRRNLIGALAEDGEDADAAHADGASREARSIKSAIELANSAIHEASTTRAECAGMGATVVATVLYDDKICIAHVGDSRAYRLRDAKLEQVTEDHSMIQELVRRGFLTAEEARTSVNKNVVTRALGVEAHVQVEVHEHDVIDGDIYLLCSDGLSDVLPQQAIEQILTERQTDFYDALHAMVERVNAAGGPDNVSIILVRAGAKFARSKQAVQHLQQLFN